MGTNQTASLGRRTVRNIYPNANFFAIAFGRINKPDLNYEKSEREKVERTYYTGKMLKYVSFSRR
jgi:hypothetical protein